MIKTKQAEKPFNLLKALDKKPRFHGNGFLQMYINDNQRLHIWTPELPPIRNHNATIHDHRFDLHSDVLFGLLGHKTFDLEEDIEGSHRIIQLEGASKVRKRPGHFVEDEYFNLILRHGYMFAAGSSYTFKSRLFHDSYSNEFTVTVITKSDTINSFARIVMEKEFEQPTHAFDPKTQPSQEVLWDTIYTACSLCGDKLLSYLGE